MIRVFVVDDSAFARRATAKVLALDPGLRVVGEAVGGAEALRARVQQDRSYVQALRDGGAPDDPRVRPSATLDWLPDVHRWQLARLTRRVQDGPAAGSGG